jgi:hypothetical protein
MAAVVANKVKRQRQQALQEKITPSPADSQLIQRKLREARDSNSFKKEEERKKAQYYQQVFWVVNKSTLLDKIKNLKI